MAKKKTKRKNIRKKNNLKKANIIIGLIVVAFAGLALLKFGLLGQQMANVFRFLFGDTYLFGATVALLFGLVLIIYGKPPRVSVKRVLGFFISYLAILGYFAINFFEQLMLHREFLASFWELMKNEFSRGGQTISVGGGLFGSAIYGLLYPIVGKTGSYVFLTIILLVGICLFFEIKAKTVLHSFQNFSQLFITKSQTIASDSKDKYDELVETRKQKRAENAKDDLPDFVDPLADDSDLPNVDGLDDDDVTQPVAPTPKTVEQDIFTDVPPVKYDTHDEKKPEPTKPTDVPDFVTSKRIGDYKLPSVDLLTKVPQADQTTDKSLIHKNTAVLQQTFKSFGVDVTIKKAVLGPTVTKYEIQPAVGVKVSRIVNLADDLALALAAKDIRIEAPIPGKPLIGIEVPNRVTSAVAFRDVVENQPQPARSHALQVPLGKDVAGQIISADLTKMPHLLIAGSTGSGKSVAINTIITSILMKAYPEEVKLVLIDPKMVELSVYNGIPHLLIPVVTDAKLAASALNKAVKEMERRYELFAASGVRNMTEYNQRVDKNNLDKDNPALEKLPYMVVIVDELSDLMMVAGREVEAAIVRLAQMARAAGIHMILATQRPSVDVITGLIKANVPSRIAFAVSSGIDSRTILDSQGAEKLIGRGDMLFSPIGSNKATRVQGAYISVEEVENVVEYVSSQQPADYDETMIPTHEEEEKKDASDSEDEYFEEAVDFIRRQQSASVSMLQRRFRVGYNRAARLIDEMEEKGVVGPSEGSKPRKVLVPPPADQS